MFPVHTSYNNRKKWTNDIRPTIEIFRVGEEQQRWPAPVKIVVHLLTCILFHNK